MGGVFLFIRSGIIDRFVAQTQSQFETLALSSGFEVKKVQIIGIQKTSQEEILKSLNLRPHQSMMSVNLSQGFFSLKRLKWIRSASIERHWPNGLIVRVNERDPWVLWKTDGKYYVIDTQGDIIEESSSKHYPQLLILSGRKAPQAFPELETLFKSEPALVKQIKGAIYVGERRWDLVLAEGTQVKLPETKISEALSVLKRILENQTIAFKNIKSIDLRLHDRFFFVKRESTEAEMERKKSQKVT